MYNLVCDLEGDSINRNFGKRGTITPAVSEGTDRPVSRGLLWRCFT
jgi:hypothetical protein